MKQKKNKCENVFSDFKFYEYFYEKASKELNYEKVSKGLAEESKLVSDREERIVVEDPDNFIKKYFSSDESLGNFDDIKKTIYEEIKKDSCLKSLLWTGDRVERSKSKNKEAIHVLHSSKIEKSALEKLVPPDEDPYYIQRG